MDAFAGELRLALTLGVSALVVFSAYRFSLRAAEGDRVAAGCDAFLLYYFIQYVLVCTLGLLGWLYAWVLLATAVALAMAGLLLVRSSNSLTPADLPGPWRNRFDSLLACACLLFVCGYLLGMVWLYRASYLTGDDALSYHLPIAASWMRTHSLHLFTTWFFNPANTYSPLTSETFMVWLMAPMGDDMLVRFVQLPALAAIWLALVMLMRGVGVRVGTAGLIATSAVLCRAFLSQASLIKDDMFMTAFFAMTLASCRREALMDRLGPWRLGIALGLFAAMKYTVVLSAPLLLLCVDAPHRAGWKRRKWAIALGIACAISAPWYLRNWVLTGNPVYPVSVSVAGLNVFAGLFRIEQSTGLDSLAGVWSAMTGKYHSIPPTLAGLLIAAWIIALVRHAARIRSEPLVRACLLGPPIGLLIFALTSHLPEIRYIFPTLILLFAAAGLALDSRIFGVALACIALVAGAPYMQNLAFFIAVGMAVTAIEIFLHLMSWRRMRWVIGSIGAVSFSCAIYVYYGSIVQIAQSTTVESWSYFYPDEAPMWRMVEEAVPRDATVAYANLHFIRPLLGWDYGRRVLYIPTHRGIRRYDDLPASQDRITDEQIRPRMAHLLAADPDVKAWLDALLAQRVAYLIVGKQPYQPQPPELLFASQESTHFRQIFDSSTGTLFQVIYPFPR